MLTRLPVFVSIAVALALVAGCNTLAELETDAASSSDPCSVSEFTELVGELDYRTGPLANATRTCIGEMGIDLGASTETSPP